MFAHADLTKHNPVSNEGVKGVSEGRWAIFLNKEVGHPRESIAK